MQSDDQMVTYRFCLFEHKDVARVAQIKRSGSESDLLSVFHARKNTIEKALMQGRIGRLAFECADEIRRIDIVRKL